MFFLVAVSVLCFRFSVRTALITQGCFSSCQVVLIPGEGFYSSPCPASKQVHKKLGARSGQLTAISRGGKLGAVVWEGPITAQELAGHWLLNHSTWLLLHLRGGNASL